MQNPNLIFGLTPIQLLLIFPIILAMYLARSQFHQAITSLSQIIYSAMRIAAKSVKQAEKRLDKRNREVLLLAGLDEAERRMEREFDRISGAVQRDLPDYPKLQRNITEVLMKLDEDYRQCSEIPQGIAEWDKVLNAIANIKPSNDPIVTNMLEDILATLKDQHKTTLESHRKDVAERHSILTRMLPVWQSISKKLDGLAKSISELINRSEQVDHYM
jgi:vacuolar-type H+-ATPase subunit H